MRREAALAHHLAHHAGKPRGVVCTSRQVLGAMTTALRKHAALRCYYCTHHAPP